MNKDLAFDRSVRHFDIDGRLHVDTSNISKAMVCPYFGHEIPNYKQLGLDANKVYQLLRHPDELKKAVDSFKNIQVLEIHKPVNSNEPLRKHTVGTTGSDVTFDGKYLKCSLAIWDAASIAGIESKDQTELSSAYHYKPDMTPGVFEGVAYDGIMRDIVGNHVALVDVGRAGPDVIVADKKPLIFRKINMKTKQRLEQAKDALTPMLAQDADLSELDKILSTLAMDSEEDDKDDKDKKKEAIAEDEDNEDDEEDDPDNPGMKRKKAKAVAQDSAPVITKLAMDAAIAEAVKQAKADMEALHIARKEVAPMVGEVALDSAEAVYKFALDQAGIDIKNVHPSAYRAIVKISQSKDKDQSRSLIGMDAAAHKKAVEQFPQLKRFTGAR